MLYSSRALCVLLLAVVHVGGHGSNELQTHLDDISAKTSAMCQGIILFIQYGVYQLIIVLTINHLLQISVVKEIILILIVMQLAK